QPVAGGQSLYPCLCLGASNKMGYKPYQVAKLQFVNRKFLINKISNGLLISSFHPLLIWQVATTFHFELISLVSPGVSVHHLDTQLVGGV
ncbi:hypothetical protein ACJX0J_029332, partial [Zea mays]